MTEHELSEGDELTDDHDALITIEEVGEDGSVRASIENTHVDTTAEWSEQEAAELIETREVYRA